MSASEETGFSNILLKLRDGQEEVYNDLFNQYLSRLTALVRSRMAVRLARKVSPEDIVLSAFRSFFVANREGRFEIDDELSLWQILVTISLRKLSKQADHFNASKRSADKENDFISHLLAREPSAEEAAIVEEEVSQLLNSLSQQDRKIVELRLQGKKLNEVSKQLGIAERTVRRRLKSITAGLSETDDPFQTAHFKLMRDFVVDDAPLEILSGLTQESIENFAIHEHVGSGGMGKVYYATRLADGQPVAIKFLKKRYLKNSFYVERFLQEAVLLQDLNHPYIVRFHAVGNVQQRGLFIVMQWVKDIIPLLHPTKQFQQHEVVNISRKAAEGLLFAHEAEIIHCDVTPGNLLLQSDGQLLISDFGLAHRNLETITVNQSTFGTAAFLSPEQASTEWGYISPKTDVYGLGATMYYLLSGTIPFPAKTIPEMMTELLSNKTPRPVRELNQSVTPFIEGLCMSCLNKDQDQRPEMQDVLSSLTGECNSSA